VCQFNTVNWRIFDEIVFAGFNIALLEAGSWKPGNTDRSFKAKDAQTGSLNEANGFVNACLKRLVEFNTMIFRYFCT
jgi:hypothetical protein